MLPSFPAGEAYSETFDALNASAISLENSMHEYEFYLFDTTISQVTSNYLQ